jgi:LysM repeat protein
MLECGGHYIFYEKNLEMQNYMIASRKRSGFTPSEIIEDRAAKNFRNLVKEKLEQNEQKSHSRMLYTVSTLLVLVVLVIGVTMINNYDKMKNVQQSLDKITESVSKKEEGEEKEEIIETLGDVVASESEEDLEEENHDSVDEETNEMTDDTTVDNLSEEVITKTYIVEEGDTLESICRSEYGGIEQMEAICRLNQLEDGNLIFIGQKLLLP